MFPFSRFIANISGSKYSHIGTVIFEDGEPVVYDTTKASVRRQPLKIWVLDTTGPFGVKRLKPEYQGRVPKVVEYLHRVYEKQVPFDYELSLDDRELYCRRDGREGVPPRRPGPLRAGPAGRHGRTSTSSRSGVLGFTT